MSLSLPKSLLWRIGLLLVGAQAVTLIIFGGVALSQVRTLFHGQVAAELQRISPVLGTRYAEDGNILNDALDRMVKADGQTTGIRITVIRPDGVVIADSQADPSTMENHRYGRPEIEHALKDGSGSSTRYSNTLGEDMVYYARTTPWGDLIVRVALPVSRINDQLSELTRLVLAAGLVSLLLTMMVAYFVSRRFTRQLAALAAAAEQYAGGNLAYHVAPPAARELSLLAVSLNRMGRQLSDRISEIKARQAEQHTILDSMSNGVMALDARRRILNINRAAEVMMSITSTAARGRLLQEVIREPKMSELVNRLLAGEPTPDAEIRFSPDPDHVIEIRGERLALHDGQSGGVLLILNDVTERLRFESLRNDFASNVSHELRTPITNIKGYVETLQDVGWQDSEQASRFLSVIRVNSDRLAAIVEDVMSLTKLERAELREDMELEDIPVTDLITVTCEQFEATARERTISLDVDVPEEIMCSGHRQLLTQALGNLLSNAIRYSPEGSTVTVAAHRDGADRFTLAVADEGHGIPPQHLPRLFERFYRVDKARSRELGGTGLGLAIVKHIALVHGGEVGVESVVGRGSVFRMTLPIRGHEESGLRPDAARARRPGHGAA